MLQKTPRKPLSVNPQVLLVYSIPKLGKSTVVAGLTTQFAPGKSIILSNEKGGYDFLEAAVEEVYNPFRFEELVDEISKDPDIQYVAIDTVTTLDDWSEYVGTFNYMRKPQGKSFNVNPSTGQRYSKDDPQFDTVHSIAQGFGYRYSRDVMVDWFEKLRGTGKTIILIAHVKDKFITSKTGEVIQSIDINLTGKVKDIYCARADAIGMLVAEEDKRYLSFQSKDDSKYMGSRASHLSGKILISEKTDKGITTYWQNIFI